MKPALPADALLQRSRIESGEFELIRKIVSGWPGGQEVVIGPGDDASAIHLPGAGSLYLQTTDLLIEDVHFRKDWGSPYQLGWKALAVNLSDIAAMGGRPLHAHLNLAIPAFWSEEEIMEFRRGFFDLASKYRISLLGGDLSASPGPLMIGVMAGGEVRADQVLRRSGARPADVVWVSGSLGNAAGGLKLLRENGSACEELRCAFLQPQAEIELGLVCSQSRAVNAMIDLSDGLAGDLGHILEASATGAILYEEKLPISPALKITVDACSWNLLDLALHGGEDYKLLGCSSEANYAKLDRLLEDKLGRKLSAIGQITKEKGLRIRRRDDRIEEIKPIAYDHFQKR